MRYTIRKPSPQLYPFVKHYWTLESCISPHSEYIHRVVPSGLFELTFYLNKKTILINNPNYSSFDSQLTGQLKGYYDIKIAGMLSLICVSFKPQGLYMFLDMPLKELYNQIIPLNYVFREGSERLVDELQNSKSFEDRITIIERFLIHQIHSRKRQYEFNRINHCIGIINRQKGLVKIEQLASACCLSRKQLERIFSNSIGTSPKQFIKIVRFQNTIHSKALNRHISLTKLAHKCGYYDQPHMIADFVTLSGLTPNQYFKECEPFSDYFQ